MNNQCHFSVVLYIHQRSAIKVKSSSSTVHQSKTHQNQNSNQFCLPAGEKTVSLACCIGPVAALSSNYRVFLPDAQSGSSVLNFSTVSELSGQKIAWLSGANKHFLTVSREWRVFKLGRNLEGQLDLGQQTTKVSSFAEISSPNDHKIREA